LRDLAGECWIHGELEGLSIRQDLPGDSNPYSFLREETPTQIKTLQQSSRQKLFLKSSTGAVQVGEVRVHAVKKEAFLVWFLRDKS
jgi:hypothetical protein